MTGTDDPVMARIGEAQQLAGNPADARGPTSRTTPPTSSSGTSALCAADRLTDERARRHHATLDVCGFYPSLHLNIAAAHEKLGDLPAALPHLPEGAYGDLVRGGMEQLRERLGP